ncbi:MAG: STAS domain-containing protein [Clostridiales bacterium]|nr:STAS domain-containing protein [Clostridiales bacterium]
MVKLKVIGQGDTVFLSGEVDVGNCAIFKEELGKIIEKTTGNVTLDLTSLDYIDSAGLGILVGVYKRLQEKNFSIKVVNANEYIKKLFRITKLETLFTIV